MGDKFLEQKISITFLKLEKSAADSYKILQQILGK
jgi:hypothetical protein